MTKRMIITTTAFVVIFGGLLAWNLFRHYTTQSFLANYEAPPVTISTAEAKTQIWQPYLTAVGNFVAVNGVDLSSEASGIVKEIHFDSGESVEAGELLVQLDDSVDQAQLRDDQAQLDLARASHQRQADLFERDATSAAALEEALAQLRQSEEAVGRTQALIAQKHITAPFAGKLGIRQVNLGEYVNPGVTELVTLQSLDPLYIRFFLPEQQLQHVYADQLLTLTVEAYPDVEFSGQVTAINSRIDANTHNIEIEANIPNEDQRLYPGMFANIQVLLPQEDDVITVPQTAVAYSLYGDSVFVVREQGEDEEGNPILYAHRQYVTLGQERGIEIAVLEGLEADDLVIDSGQLKLENDTRVVINNEIQLQQQMALQP